MASIVEGEEQAKLRRSTACPLLDLQTGFLEDLSQWPPQPDRLIDDLQSLVLTVQLHKNMREVVVGRTRQGSRVDS